MLRLRPYKPCDAETIVSWIKDEKSFRQWSADRFDTYPITADDLNNHYEEMAHVDTFFEMTAFDETGIVGHLIMRFVDEDKANLRLGFIIVDADKRGKGYGKEMIQLAVKYAFEILKVKKVTLGVFENNENAHQCYLASGFKDSDMPEIEYVHLMNEEWKLIEMELNA